MAILAVGRVALALAARLAVDARRELLHLGLVAGGAERGAARGRLSYIVIAVAGHAPRKATRLAERQVRARRERLRDLPVARQAGGSGGFCGVRKPRGAAVTIQAAKIFVNARPERLRVHRDVPAPGIRQARARAVAGKTIIGRTE